jgi:putative PEP-CTERM system TPR-repeat lipoprotein
MLGAALLAKGQPHVALTLVGPMVATTADPGILGIAAEANRLMGRLGQARALAQRGLKLDQKNGDLLLSLARTDLASGARQRAIAGLESVIALEPANSRADETLVFVLLGKDEIDRAEQVASALARRRPDAASTYVLQGAVQISKKDFTGARASLDRALQLDPGNLDAIEAMADVDAAEKKPDRRRERISRLLERNNQNIGALLALAKLDLAQGRQEESVTTIRRALSEQPESGNALLMLADLQYRNGQIEQAVITARQAYQLHPFDTRTVAALGTAQLAVGDTTGAILTLTKLTTLQPDVVSGYLRLAGAQLAAGNVKAAEATMLAALGKNPKDRGAKALLADIYLREGELDRAQELAAQVQKENPKDALGYRIQGDVLLARKDFAHAFDAYRKAAAVKLTGALLVKMHQAQRGGRGGAVSDEPLRAWVAKNPQDVEVRFYLAGIIDESGRHKEAAEQYREILRREPNSPRALNNLAWALHAAGDKRALEYARHAVELAPKSAIAVDTFGWVLLGQGNLAEGVPALLKAVGLDESNPEIRYHLVQGLFKIGDERRAREELRTVLASNKPFPQLAEARALAAKLGH